MTGMTCELGMQLTGSFLVIIHRNWDHTHLPDGIVVVIPEDISKNVDVVQQAPYGCGMIQQYLSETTPGTPVWQTCGYVQFFKAEIRLFGSSFCHRRL